MPTRSAASRRRPSGAGRAPGEFCSRHKCKELATAALAAAKETEKDRRIAELELQVKAQATEIALLRKRLSQRPGLKM